MFYTGFRRVISNLSDYLEANLNLASIFRKEKSVREITVSKKKIADMLHVTTDTLDEALIYVNKKLYEEKGYIPFIFPPEPTVKENKLLEPHLNEEII